jgi:hypothetical protein
MEKLFLKLKSIYYSWRSGLYTTPTGYIYRRKDGFHIEIYKINLDKWNSFVYTNKNQLIESSISEHKSAVEAMEALDNFAHKCYPYER